jgi:hypothetical protein
VTGLSAAALTLLAAGPVHADTVRTQTTTYRGVVTDIDPGASTIILKSEERPQPMRYTINEKTTFVDAAGNVVTREKIRNEPVTIYTTDDGVVTKVIESGPSVQRKTTTTTEHVETPD